MAIAVFTSFGQICDNNGDPLNGGTVTVQAANTTTPLACFTDTGLSVSATNPIPLDSAGRHTQGMVYIAAAAYKVIVKNSGGTTLFTRDNIDPGVPIGAGALAVANGGTGATTAGAALTNLGGATAAELADVAADVAAISGALGSTEKTHIATGTTAQRPAAPADGDIRRNTTIPQYEVYNGSAWKYIVTEDYIATTSEMEAASATAKVVTPAGIARSPFVAKAYALFSQSGSHSLTTQIGVTSIADGGTGLSTLTWSTAFSSANYSVVGSISQSDLAGGFITCAPVNTTTANIQCRNTSGTATDFTAVSIAAFGDL